MKTRIKRVVQGASVTGVALIMMAANAGAANITYTTDTANTGFDNTPANFLDSSGGSTSATLMFDPNPSSTSGTPSNIDLGDFILTCSACSTSSAASADAIFGAFTFNLIVTDTTDGASGQFVGTSSGGTVYSDTSTVDIDWSPLQLGPGTNNTLASGGGNFGLTEFTISAITEIVAPTSGSTPGDTSVQGIVTTSSLAPEPASASLLIGGALAGLGLLRRRRRLS